MRKLLFVPAKIVSARADVVIARQARDAAYVDAFLRDQKPRVTKGGHYEKRLRERVQKQEAMRRYERCCEVLSLAETRLRTLEDAEVARVQKMGEDLIDEIVAEEKAEKAEKAERAAAEKAERERAERDAAEARIEAVRERHGCG